MPEAINFSAKNGVILLAASTLYCGFAKYQGISTCSWTRQIGAFGVAAVAKIVIDSWCDTDSEELGMTLLNGAMTAVVLGTASKFCQFKCAWGALPQEVAGSVLSTLAISVGYFGMQQVCEPPKPEPPPEPNFEGLEEVTLTPALFKSLLFTHRLPPIPITVEGDLEFPDNIRCYLLRDIPESPELRTFPQQLTINGSLRIRNCPHFTGLPADIQVTGYIGITNCPSFRTLPPRFRTQKSLYISHCKNFTELPEGMDIRGRFTISTCPLSQLPSRLRIGENLEIDNCRGITALPLDTVVGGGLRINASRIVSIPPNFASLKFLYLEDCIDLVELPEKLTIFDPLQYDSDAQRGLSKDLILFNCFSLDHLPQGLRVEGNLKVSRDEGMLPPGFRELYCGGFTEDLRRFLPPERDPCEHKIRELPDYLFVGGNVEFHHHRTFRSNFKDYPTLRSIGKGVRIEGDLILPGGCSIEELPEDLFIGGNIDLSYVKLKRLPSWITKIGPKKNGEVRDINLKGTQIRQEDIDFLKRGSFPGIQFFVDDYQEMFFKEDPYDIYEVQENLRELGLDSFNRPTKKEIKKAYYRLAKIYHPDKSQETAERFQKIQGAYAKLTERTDIPEG